MAVEKRAYALKESITDFNGGSTTLKDGRTLNFGARLRNNDGVIVTSDEQEIVALDNVQSLKTVPVPGEADDKKSASKSDRADK